MKTYALIRQHGQRNRTPITAVLVTDFEERRQSLRNVVGERCEQLQNMIFSMYHRMSEDYRGGDWDWYRLSNGGVYMAPRIGGTISISCESMYRAQVSAQAAGLIACAMAYSYLSLAADGDCYGRGYLLLFPYLAQQPDAACIFAALD